MRIVPTCTAAVAIFLLACIANAQTSKAPGPATLAGPPSGASPALATMAERYGAWHAGLLAEQGDIPFLYFAGDLERTGGARATVRFMVGGSFGGGTVAARPVRRMRGPDGDTFVPMADSTPALYQLPAGQGDAGQQTMDVMVADSADAVLLSLMPNGSFDDSRTLQLVLPVARSGAHGSFLAALASSVRCPKGCYMLQSSCIAPSTCNIDSLLVCCKSRILTVDCETCTIACGEGSWCPVIVVSPEERERN